MEKNRNSSKCVWKTSIWLSRYFKLVIKKVSNSEFHNCLQSCGKENKDIYISNNVTTKHAYLDAFVTSSWRK